MIKQQGKFRFLVYFAFLFTVAFSSCQKQELEKETPKPTPIQPAPSPDPSNPDECLTKASADNGAEIAGQYLVKYKDGASASINSTLPGCASRAKVSFSRFKKILIGKASSTAVANLTQQEVNDLKNDSEVESIEPDRVVSIVSCATPAPAQTTPWGVTRVGGSDGRGKTIWVIDTGVDLDHPDLTVDGARSKSFIPGKTPDDDNGHGTHVSGIIAAKDNSVGVIGVAAGATIVAVKVMDASGKGSSSILAQAVNYVSQNARPGDVVNMSVGGGISEILDNAVIEAASKGILFSIAAGNDHEDVSNSSPARVENTNVYTISSINNADEYAPFSNFGKGVDYAAPGVNISSTFMGGGYATMSGTSMAAPHMAGLLAVKGKAITTSGFAKNDPDGKADPIAHK